MSSVLKVHNLTKYYQQFCAVDNISFELNKGEVLGLLGPNGAGKTTTIQIILGLTEPDAGSIHYFGKSLADHRTEILEKTGFASAYSQLQGKITVRQNLEIYARLFGLSNFKKRIQFLAELLEFEPVLDHLFWHLSSGQKTRAVLAKALLNQPKLLLLDEPTASLDPEIVNKMIGIIKQLQAEEQISILYTSHNMEEVSRLCDRVIFLRAGKIRAVDSPKNLTKLIDVSKIRLEFRDASAKMEKYLNTTGFKYHFITKHQVEVSLEESQIPKLLFGCAKHDIFITSIAISQPSLEDVFLKVAQEQREFDATAT